MDEEDHNCTKTSSDSEAEWAMVSHIALLKRATAEGGGFCLSGSSRGMLFSGTNALSCFGSIGNSWNSDKESKTEKVKGTAQKLRIPVPETRLPLLGFVKSLALKQLISGSVAGGVSSVATVPFAILKTKVVARHGGDSTREVLQNIAKFEGLQSLLPSSTSSWILSIFLASLKRGVQFVTFEAVKRSEEQRRAKDPKVLPLPRAASISTLSGALSAVAALFVSYPFTTIQDRTILQSQDYPSTFGALAKVFCEEGIRGLYTGLGPEMIRMVVTGAAEFYAYDTLKNKCTERTNKPVSPLASLLLGAVSGAFSTALAYPLELARKEVSLSAVPNIEYTFSNTFQALRAITARDGFRGLYTGLELELLQMVPATAVSFLVYEVMKRALVAVAEEKLDEVKDQ